MPQKMDDLVSVIQTLDLRYQKIYGHAALMAWGSGFLIIVIWFKTLQWKVALFLAPITLVMVLFVMRLWILWRSQKLWQEVLDWMQKQNVVLEDLIQEARSLEPQPVFFIELIDGPMVRAKRGKR